MDSESIRYLFDSLSHQIRTTRGELKEDLSNLRYDLNKFMQAQEVRHTEMLKRMEERERFENKALGAWAVIVFVVQVLISVVPSLMK